MTPPQRYEAVRFIVEWAVFMARLDGRKGKS